MINLNINDKSVQFDGDENMPLLWYLRDDLRLTGTKFGCGIAMCGACTVHLDGKPVRSCQTPMIQTQGKNVTTVEAVNAIQVGAQIQRAWQDLDVVQCGYCQSGQIMSATALLMEKIAPSDADIDAAMGGNVCRCATYVRIRAAIHLAADRLQTEAGKK
ncbi:(2Fe-2S)-binding protein [Pantoea rwandensis]|uniref:Isoquinoline 1-oxidoreductase n=1 Tax=Pantoea rwandensis TaxID=1076550 RepID=A0A1X1D5J7_9GAMM|nr:(2Fe-2S)-binding protein [Pantoea rwandensis]ORM71781.1 isoquinoline 1-oxidoreductase [Pantoea rwandensis]